MPDAGAGQAFPVLQGPVDQRSKQRLNINSHVAQPALTAPLPAGGQAMAHGKDGLPAVETDRVAEQQSHDPPGQQQQATLIPKRAV